MSGLIDAGQTALAAEQAIVYGYGVVGAHLSGAPQVAAAAALRVHQQRRDDLAALITASRVVPVAAQPAYQVPFAVTTPAAARRLATTLESGGAGAAWDLVAAAPASSRWRSLAIAWLSDAAIRIGEWGGAIPPLPGQPLAKGTS
jgi:hypothetical protein